MNLSLHKRSSLQEEREYYNRVIRGLEGLHKIRIRSKERPLNDSIEGLVFSKDRPMQLCALLHSYFHCAQHPAHLTVLFKASDDRFKEAYDQLIGEVKHLPVLFIHEADFYTQVCKWAQKSNADRIFFMTDDAIFLEPFDFADILAFDPFETIFSLTKGADLTFCFNHNHIQKLPAFTEKRHPKNRDQFFLEWVWEEMEGSPDWMYPLSVDATFFVREEIAHLLTHIRFRNPNTLEANLQVFVRAFLPLKGACYAKARYVNIPCNLVQNEVVNRTTGTFSVEQLLEIWMSGQRIDTSKFLSQEVNVARAMKFDFV